MGWVHRYKHRGAVLALIALALQIALTFGHVQLRGLAGGSQRAIAEQIRLAHAPPQLLVPANFQRVEHWLNAASLIAKPPRLAFRSRAPPTANVRSS